ncbi:class I SAM-dependent methyltransferase [Mycolicibacterium arseniciresistens]|uniref:Class I SAM-dependent methyltransferase n=1 Tax=Mycolicibacterium arseniciresistens TaxID=3062257 RepID=A0ABT8UKK2_9MYCO|nr:class I SAM-dependent methyltransferase [Mycolicibacterium arseniciresistens]MDO3638333.1 class I SAM-dependent methyltransferase [Mycolicibacterium arseniciresistens]
MLDAAISRRYTEIADVYIDMFGAVEHVDPEDLQFLHRHLGRCDGTVLDVGCGPGHLTAYLTELGAIARGVDLVPAFIDGARSHWPELDFAVGSMRDLDVPDHSLGGILAWYSLIHCEPTELGAVLAGFRRSMKHDGTLVVGFFEGDELEPFDHKVITAHRWPIDQLSRLLSAVGFVETERMRRAGNDRVRPHAALALRATCLRQSAMSSREN